MTTTDHRLVFTETVSVPHAKALLRLSKDEFIKAMYDPTEKDQKDQTFSQVEQDIYIKSIKKYLRLVISKGGKIQQQYKYQKGMERY